MIQPTTNYQEILSRLERVDVSQYAATRNYLDGAVSNLSPFISRGVLSLPQLSDAVLEKFSFSHAYRFINQLTWREYFQRVWWKYGNDIFTNLKGPFRYNARQGMSTNIIEGKTGITVLDDQVKQLYTTGYLHNHVRMYLASLACPMGQCDWRLPSQWMYYHLLDGDIASNTLSWQWVAGTFSNKEYVFNQENLNHYSSTTQRDTFIDVPYEKLSTVSVPEELRELSTVNFTTLLPPTSPPSLDYSKPLLIYNSYNLDPLWQKDLDANRVLLLEPSHFKKFPVSEKVIKFILNLASNINGIQIITGEIEDVPGIEKFSSVTSKDHPAFRHYPGYKTAAQWMFPKVELTPSFSSFWKKCERSIATK
ncbi:hypothetical protein BH09BAC3_BH09BAC3_09850 [soil metagenome]